MEEIEASGDAVVTACTPRHAKGCTQVDIIVGKEAIRTMRPTSAGLTKFCPMPPKNCLTTTIATTLPIAATHSGMVAGRLKARRMPVTMALRSPSVLGRFMILRLKNSLSMQVSTVVAVMSSVRGPKSQTLAARAGIREMITSSMIPVVVSAERTCGDALTVSFCFKLISSVHLLP